MTKPTHHTTSHLHIPGGVYLCQVNERVSCGACCGLYNMKEISKQTLSEMLLERTEKFKETHREMDAIIAFGEESKDKISENLLYPDFHHCPYIGLIGDNPSLVGCLLHPLSTGNSGIDFRGLSFYGGLACNTYFCPSHKLLSPPVKRIIRNAADDWYTFGLMVTETALLQFIFEEIRQNSHPSLTLDALANHDAFLIMFHEFMELKITWPYRPAAHPSPCNYFFNDKQYTKPEVVYPSKKTQPSRYHRLFQELISRFSSPKDLRRAESLMGSLIDRLVSSIPYR